MRVKRRQDAGVLFYFFVIYVCASNDARGRESASNDAWGMGVVVLAAHACNCFFVPTRLNLARHVRVLTALKVLPRTAAADLSG